jgi:hypothetical protein
MLFNRVAAVEIQPVAAPALAFRVEGVRIEFTVKKDRDKTSNTAEVNLYNLAEDTRARFRRDDLLLLYAGYEDETGAELVFAGDLVTVAHETRPPEIITKLEANDGGRRGREKRIALSYSADTSAPQVLQDILKQYGAAIKAFGTSIPAAKFRDKFLERFRDSKYLQGFTFEGRAEDALEKLGKRLGLTITSQNNELKIIAEDGDDGSPQVVLLSPETGLIGSPERLAKREEDAKDKPKEEGWKITALLQPKAEPGGVVAVQSAAIGQQTQFQVQRLTHKGDTHGQPWETVLEVLDRTGR